MQITLNSQRLVGWLISCHHNFANARGTDFIRNCGTSVVRLNYVRFERHRGQDIMMYTKLDSEAASCKTNSSLLSRDRESVMELDSDN